MLPLLVEVYVKPVLSSDSNTTGSEDLLVESKVFLMEIVALASKKRIESWIMATCTRSCVNILCAYSAFL